MTYENNNAFTDWLYNRYVESLRKKDIVKQFLFFDVINEFLKKALSQRKFSQQRRYANSLLRSIQKAHKNGTTEKLQLSGEEWQREFEKAIADYERNLRELDFDEEHIQELIIEKKCNYGND
jgi:predicted amidophosphoribosyltransferase